MKKCLFSLFLILCICGTMFVPTFAASSSFDVASFNPLSLTEVSTDVEYFEDGSYLVTTVKSSPTPRADVYTKTGTKEVTLYDEDNNIQWIYYLVGTFTVETGVSCVCTNSTFTYTIYVNKWSLTEHNNWYSNNAAFGTATFKKKILFITTSTQELEGAVWCDVYGVIS